MILALSLLITSVIFYENDSDQSRNEKSRKNLGLGCIRKAVLSVYFNADSLLILLDGPAQMKMTAGDSFEHKDWGSVCLALHAGVHINLYVVA